MVSALGFGCMRFPTIDNNEGQIDEHTATQMIHYAIDHGVNYLDTAYFYHKGNSERFLGKALQNGYREKIKLVTKLPLGEDYIQSEDDFDRLLDEQLERLQTDHVDFYLLHNLFEKAWHRSLKFKVFDRAEKAMADGRINHLGFSFHDRVDLFKEIVDAYDNWTLCQIQYNYVDEDFQAGTEGLQYAAERGLAIVVMEPLRGGVLATPPKGVDSLWRDAGKDPVEMSLQWLWDKPEVSVLISGMSTLDQVKQNVGLAGRSNKNALTENDFKLIDDAKATFESYKAIPCTQCRYCMPCPNGVDIPRNFQLYNQAKMFDSLPPGKFAYNMILTAEERAENCIACLECEEKCPQQIAISQLMPEIHDLLKKE